MSDFFTADLHLDHYNPSTGTGILKHTDRPFSTIEEMNEAFVSNWNAIVTKKDTTYVLGDFAWKRHNYWAQRLNGHKVLIPGNHDKMSQISKNAFTIAPPLLERKFNKQRIIMCHYAMRTWSASHHDSWHLYGHSHGRLPEFLIDKETGLKTYFGSSFDVGVDVWDYAPVSFEMVAIKMQKIIESKAQRDPKWYDDDFDPQEVCRANRSHNYSCVATANV